MRSNSFSWSSDECRPLPCSTCKMIVAVWPKPRTLNDISFCASYCKDVSHYSDQNEEVIEPELLHYETTHRETRSVSIAMSTTTDDKTDRSRTKRTAIEYCAKLTRFNNGPWSAAADIIMCPMSIRMPIFPMSRGSSKKHGVSPTNTRLRGA